PPAFKKDGFHTVHAMMRRLRERTGKPGEGSSYVFSDFRRLSRPTTGGVEFRDLVDWPCQRLPRGFRVYWDGQSVRQQRDSFPLHVQLAILHEVMDPEPHLGGIEGKLA